MSYRKQRNPVYAERGGLSSPKCNLKGKRSRKTGPRAEPKGIVSYKGELIPASARKTAIDFVREFRKCGIKYVLAGAFPVQFYGRERYSRDVDIVVSIDEKGAENLFKFLKSGKYALVYPLEYEHTISSPMDLLDLKIIKVRDMETRSLVDIILRPSEVGFDFDSESEERVRIVALNGEEVPIPSPEDYIIMKLKSRRPSTHDFEDIISTLSTQFNVLDWSYLGRRAEEENLTSLLSHYKESVERKMKRGEPH